MHFLHCNFFLAKVAKAEESNDNYQREMILHSSAVQELLLLKVD